MTVTTLYIKAHNTRSRYKNQPIKDIQAHSQEREKKSPSNRSFAFSLCLCAFTYDSLYLSYDLRLFLTCNVRPITVTSKASPLIGDNSGTSTLNGRPQVFSSIMRFFLCHQISHLYFVYLSRTSLSC